MFASLSFSLSLCVSLAGSSTLSKHLPDFFGSYLGRFSIYLRNVFEDDIKIYCWQCTFSLYPPLFPTLRSRRQSRRIIFINPVFFCFGRRVSGVALWCGTMHSLGCSTIVRNHKSSLSTQIKFIRLSDELGESKKKSLDTISSIRSVAVIECSLSICGAVLMGLNAIAIDSSLRRFEPVSIAAHWSAARERTSQSPDCVNPIFMSYKLVLPLSGIGIRRMHRHRGWHRRTAMSRREMAE